jgi:hypothetical protein
VGLRVGRSVGSGVGLPAKPLGRGVGGAEGPVGPVVGVELEGMLVEGKRLGDDVVGLVVDGLEVTGDRDGVDVEGLELEGLVVDGEPVGRDVGSSVGHCEYRNLSRTQPPFSNSASCLTTSFTNTRFFTSDPTMYTSSTDIEGPSKVSTDTWTAVIAAVKSTIDSCPCMPPSGPICARNESDDILLV